MIAMKKLLFGTAGIPVSTEGDSIEGIKCVKNLGLGAMELEFVRSINITKEKAPYLKEAAERNSIVLTCHAPYFINLASMEKKIFHASVNRIISSARIAALCGCYSVCFHAGYYMKQPAAIVYKKMKAAMKDIVQTLNKEENNIWIRPEVSGRVAQFGSLEEVIKLSEDIEQVLPCIDFSHLHARSNGKFNTFGEFSLILSAVEKSLGKEALRNMHIHVSGIAYGEKGEKNHLNLPESDMNYKDLMNALREFKICGVVISESPNIEKDALLMKKTYEGR